jgi:hypothetical protein
MRHWRLAVASWFGRRYSRQGLWSLFLMCALPLHAWTMIMAFRDLSWLTDRTNAWDAIGVLCYGLLFALIESLLVFLLAALLGFLILGRWDQEQRIAVLTVLVLVLSLWAMAEQLFFLLNVRVPSAIIGLLVRVDHPLRVLNLIILAVVAVTLMIPVLQVLRSKPALAFVGGMIERLSVLAMFYLVFDVAALVIVLVRNL